MRPRRKPSAGISFGATGLHKSADLDERLKESGSATPRRMSDPSVQPLFAETIVRGTVDYGLYNWVS